MSVLENAQVFPGNLMVKRVPQVSSFGRLRNQFGIISTPTPRTSGYVLVWVYGRTQYIHRLMAVAFRLPKRDDQIQVNHIDGNPSNNHVSNLEWSSRSENISHSFSTNAHRRSSAPKLSKPVMARKRGLLEWTSYPSATDAGKTLGIHCGSIRQCCSGKRPTAGGFEFKFDLPIEVPVLDGEEWREVHGGAAVSSFGRFRSTTGVVSTPTPRCSGYVTVRIQGKGHSMHRIVAQAFNLPRREDQDHVNHKDGNPSNNCITNLEWVSVSENVQHSYATNTHRKSSATKKSKPIMGRKIGAEWILFESSEDAARRMGVNRGSVTLCCSGVRKSAGGCEFKYAAPNEVEWEGEEWRDVVEETCV